MTAPKIGIIRGDGIGPELIEASLTALEAVATTGGPRLQIVEIDAGADTYRRTGAAMSREDLELIRTSLDATMKGPVGLPDVRMPDGTEAGPLGGIMRLGLDTYANVRPIRLFPGLDAPLSAPAGIDYVIVRENTEGLYASRGKGVGNRWAVTDTSIATREGCLRIARFAFELSGRRHGAPADGVRRVTCVDKSNVLRSHALFRDTVYEIAEQYPAVEVEFLYADAAAQALVLRPEHFDVLVMENLLGDILSDLGGATIGGISLCPSGNIGDAAAYFEPIHGSAPGIANQGIANPLGQILAAAMMLDHLGFVTDGDRIRAAVGAVLRDGTVQLRPDGSAVGGPIRVATVVADVLAEQGSASGR